MQHSSDLVVIDYDDNARAFKESENTKVNRFTVKRSNNPSPVRGHLVVTL